MENKKVGYYVEGQALYYEMPKELDHHVAEKLCAEVDMLIESYRIAELVLDFKNTEFMDSSGIGFLIGRSKTMRFRGGRLCVQRPGKRIDEIFRSTGLYKLVERKEV